MIPGKVYDGFHVVSNDLVSGMHALKGNTDYGNHLIKQNVMYGGHNSVANEHTFYQVSMSNYVYGNHTQEWFGDRFIQGIQAENLEFIKDNFGKIILEE